MQPKTQITSKWKDAAAVEQYRTGVSLHSHTSCSEETLKFVHIFLAALPWGARVMQRYERICAKNYGLTLDFERAFWRPPMLPKMAFELEAGQIGRMGLEPLVSITDHDTIEAPMLLRTVPSARHIPVSVEWSAPFGDTEFHLGIHNLPSADGPEWMRRFAEYTAEANAARCCEEEYGARVEAMDKRLLAMVRELDATPGVLVVFNHPVWDLHEVGEAAHRREVMRFIAAMGGGDSCAGAERAAAREGESRGDAARAGYRTPDDLRRRPAWAGAECECEPDATREASASLWMRFASSGGAMCCSWSSMRSRGRDGFCSRR